MHTTPFTDNSIPIKWFYHNATITVWCSISPGSSSTSRTAGNATGSRSLGWRIPWSCRPRWEIGGVDWDWCSEQTSKVILGQWRWWSPKCTKWCWWRRVPQRSTCKMSVCCSIRGRSKEWGGRWRPWDRWNCKHVRRITRGRGRRTRDRLGSWIRIKSPHFALKEVVNSKKYELKTEGDLLTKVNQALTLNTEWRS